MDAQQNPVRTAASASQAIVCAKCERSNPPSHRFCQQCGSILWQKCADCSAERPIDEAFCAACGADIQSAARQLVELQRRRLADAHEMIERLELNEAIHSLQYLTRQHHPSLEEITAAAEQLLPEVVAQREEHLERARSQAGQARILLDERKPREAMDVLKRIPVSLREQGVRQQLDEAQQVLHEIEQLNQVLTQRDGPTLLERMAAIDRLLELDPHCPDLQRWSNRIHDHLLSAANAKVKAHRFDDAHDLLGALPDKLHSEQSRKLPALRRRARAPGPRAGNGSHGGCGQPGGGSAPRKRRAHRRTDPGAAPENDRPVSHGPADRSARHLGSLPGRDVGGRAGRSLPDAPAAALRPSARTLLQQRPGSFLVACGLALQALGQGDVQTNLLPNEKRGLMDLLKSPLRERPAESGWGIDLGTTGLKAVRLAVEDGQVQITHSFYQAHRLPTNHPDAVGVVQSLLRESLEAFLAEHTIEDTARVATQWPAIFSLTRFLTVPRIEGKKLRRADSARGATPDPLAIARSLLGLGALPTRRP